MASEGTASASPIVVRGIEVKKSWWIVSVWIYYTAVFTLVPRISCQWPFHKNRLWFFGLIPLAVAVVGLCVYQDQMQRMLAWIVFSLAVAGICISFQPWCNAVGLPTW
jgi:hypothetical protein